MRATEELERLAFKEALTPEEDDRLVDYLMQRGAAEPAAHFCVDLRSKAEEPPVVFRPHDGTSDETWTNFAAWVEECWLNGDERQ